MQPATRKRGLEPGPVSAGPSVSTLFGRERELRELLAGLGEAVDGHGRLFLIAGEDGIGKTRLAEEVSSHAERLGARVAWGRAWDGDGAPPYWPWLQVLRALAGEASAPAPDDRHELGWFDAVMSALRAAAQTQPLVVVLDDLHAADRASLHLLRLVARELADVSVLAVGTYRDVDVRQEPELAQLFAGIARHARRMLLGGLSLADLTDFVNDIAGFAPDPRVVKAVLDASDGNPFFADELVRLLLARGKLRPGQLVSTAEMGIPDGVREAIRQRLEGLPPDVRAVISTAAVLGRRFAVPTLAQVSPFEPEVIADALTVAEAGGVVVRLGTPPGRFRFTHALTREVVYSDLSAPRRLVLHRNAAEALEKVYGEHPDHVAEIGYHYLRGGPADKAIHFAWQAARQARLLLAYDQAVARFREALDLLELGPPDDARLCDLLLELGACEWRAGDAMGARASFSRAAGLARRTGAGRQLAVAALGLGGARAEAGQVDPNLVALLEEAIELLDGRDLALHSRLLGRLAVALYFSDGLARRHALADRAITAAQQAGAPAIVAAARSAAHFARWAPDNASERAEQAESIARLGREANDPELVLEGRTLQIADLLELGEIEAAWQLLAEYIPAAEQLRLPLYRWYALLFQSNRALLEGRITEAEHLARFALRIGRRSEIPNAEQFFTAQLCAVRAEQGRLDELATPLVTFVTQYPALVIWRCAHVWMLAELGRQDEARRELAALADSGFAGLRRDLNWLGAMALLARACHRLGAAGHAEELYGLLRPYRGRWTVAASGVVCFGSAQLALGMLAATAGRAEQATDHYEEALAAHALHAPLWAAHTSRFYGELLVASGRPRDVTRGADLLAAADRFHGVAPPHRLASDPGEVGGDEAELRKEGEFWTVAHRGVSAHLRDSKGLRLIAHLLAHPGRQFRAGELATLGVGAQPAGITPATLQEDGMVVSGLGDAGEVIDVKARDAYRRRLEQLDAELDTVRRAGDATRERALTEEMAFIGRELSAGVGIGGRPRTAASAEERARLSVTKAIRGAQHRIDEHHPALGRHLAVTLRTGRFCSYNPELDPSVRWRLS
jgi:predicted ATPase